MINNPYTTGIQFYIFSWASFLKQEENSLLEEEEKSHSFKTQSVLTAKPHYLKKFFVQLLN